MWYNRYMNILKQIFLENYEEMIYTLHPRDAVIENVEKMIHCGDSEYGCAMFGCEKCGELKFVPFTCKSRFCPSCGTKYAMARTTAMSFKMIKCKHRHCVFTIDDTLRPFFLKDRSLLNILFTAVQTVVLAYFNKLNKGKNFTPGMICVLHTFGRDLKWNPHIHCLISEGGLADNGEWKKLDYFNYKYLRDAFQTVLLNLMHSSIGDPFKKFKSASHRNHKNGFYVYARKNQCNPRNVVKYIGRYLGRPVIATSRIDKYDGDFVTFHYNRHEDDKLIHETIPVMDFIKRIIRHIPEKHFKMIRYYGLYARHRSIDNTLFKAVPAQKHRFLLSMNKWRMSIGFSFGYDPLKCPNCGCQMCLLELHHNYKRVPLDELYAKAIRKYKQSVI